MAVGTKQEQINASQDQMIFRLKDMVMWLRQRGDKESHWIQEVVSNVASYVTAIYADAHAICSTRCHCGYKQMHRQCVSSAETTKN